MIWFPKMELLFFVQIKVFFFLFFFLGILNFEFSFTNDDFWNFHYCFFLSQIFGEKILSMQHAKFLVCLISMFWYLLFFSTVWFFHKKIQMIILWFIFFEFNIQVPTTTLGDPPCILHHGKNHKMFSFLLNITNMPWLE